MAPFSLRATLTAIIPLLLSALPPSSAATPPTHNHCKPLTTRTPEFLGLTMDLNQAWGKSSFGRGVVIGVIDSGLNSFHPSFDDAWMPSPPPTFRGSCSNAGGRFRCNRKIVGARSFFPGESAPYDPSGHGTHVASTAAGVFVSNASYDGQAAGTAAGTAPGAHLAIYKVCDRSNKPECPNNVMLDGFAAAVADRVDVISVSVGAGPAGIKYLDPVIIGSFIAEAAGIVVVAAAGNSGPRPETVANDAPWQLTVASGSVDRSISAQLLLGNGSVVLRGEAVQQGDNSPQLPLYYPESCMDIDAQSASGHIVVCDDIPDPQNLGIMSRVVRQLYDDMAAAHVVVVSPQKWGYTIVLVEFGASVVQVVAADGRRIRDYCSSSSPGAAVARVVFTGTQIGQALAGAPMVPYFSSRGPSSNNPFVLKPDLLAPGLNILGASGMSDGFVFRTGTSMAAPHVSGVAALVRSLHPDWSPAAVRSSLVTTTRHSNSHGGLIFEDLAEKSSLFITGAGQVDPNAAVNVALVYDQDPRDYKALVCSTFGSRNDILTQFGIKDGCIGARYMEDTDLNYPSLMLPPNATVWRTLTRVEPGEDLLVFQATVKMRDPTVQVNVVPSELRFQRYGDRVPFQVSADFQGRNTPEEGFLEWTSEGHQTISSPIIVSI